MDINRFTQKCQEAFHEAQVKAVRLGHQEVDTEHLLLALVTQKDGLVAKLLDRVGVSPTAFGEALEKELEKRPSVSGPGVEPGSIYFTQRVNKVMVKAEEEAKRLKDEYVSVEHLVLAMFDEEQRSGISKLFGKDF